MVSHYQSDVAGPTIIDDAGLSNQTQNLICPLIRSQTLFDLSLIPIHSNMSDEKDLKAYNHRLLAALDSSIAAGRDFVVGRGWSPLVNVGMRSKGDSLM
jgi:hypothetical protein